MGKFRTAQGAQSIACAHKANAGHLFCLEKSFVFIHKPTVIVKHEDIETVEFERAGQGAATRNFDLRLQLKGGGSRVQDATFTGIARDEYPVLLAFVQSKQLHVTNLKANAMQQTSSGRHREELDHDP